MSPCLVHVAQVRFELTKAPLLRRFAVPFRLCHWAIFCTPGRTRTCIPFDSYSNATSNWATGANDKKGESSVTIRVSPHSQWGNAPFVFDHRYRGGTRNPISRSKVLRNEPFIQHGNISGLISTRNLAPTFYRRCSLPWRLTHFCQGEWTRTTGLLLPREVIYSTDIHPVKLKKPPSFLRLKASVYFSW